MDISDIISKTDIKSEAALYLEKIVRHPEFCRLLAEYYQRIRLLKPSSGAGAINEKKLALIISWAFSRISVMLSISKQQGLAETIFNICCLLISRLINEFECHGERLDNMITNIIMDYSCTLPVGGEELIALFLEDIEKKNTSPAHDKKCRCSSVNNRLICYNNAVEELIVAELDGSGWIMMPGTSRILFSYNDEMIHIKNKRLCNLALFTKMAWELNLIEPEFGKGYIGLVSKHLFVSGTPVSDKYFKNLCFKVWNNAENKYNDTHQSVGLIIDKILKVRNCGNQG